MEEPRSPLVRVARRRPERRLVTLSSVTERDDHVKRFGVTCPERGQYSPEWPFRIPVAAAERGRRSIAGRGRSGDLSVRRVPSPRWVTGANRSRPALQHSLGWRQFDVL